jgi:hypothetical protein
MSGLLSPMAQPPRVRADVHLVERDPQQLRQPLGCVSPESPLSPHRVAEHGWADANAGCDPAVSQPALLN